MIMSNTTETTVPVQTVKLELTLDEANIVLAGLGELPAKASLGVIDKVRSQAVSQLQAAAAVAAEAAQETVSAESAN
jgi:hypothetical protein